MIVKNEAKILERCLASIPCDTYIIGDTGSTDGTPDLIRTHFDKRGILGEIHEFPFYDYSQARNEALKRARETKLSYDCILLCDADMELVVSEKDWKEQLHQFPVASVVQKGGITYRNTRIVHRSVGASYVGKTHEYLSTSMAARDFDGIWFRDHANGANRNEKTSRDLRLLKESLKEDPQNGRSWFYLAQTYKYEGQWTDALEAYTRRIQIGGSNDEVWYSRYMRALCYQKLGLESAFVNECLETYQSFPKRSEPLHLLSRHYREQGKNELAYAVAALGEEIHFPEKNGGLFIEDWVYESGCFESEMSIAGFYVQNPEKRETARELCLRLSIDPNVDGDIQAMALRNSEHYAKSAEGMFPSFEKHRIAFAPPSGRVNPVQYTPMNPSIAANPDGELAMVIRTVNYTMDSFGSYRMPADGVIRTKNYLCKPRFSESYGDPLNPEDTDIVIESSRLLLVEPSEPLTQFPVQGYEDCRLFWWKGKWWCSATVRDRHKEGFCEIAIFCSDGSGDRVLRVGDVIDTSEHQKNWMPLVLDDPADGRASRLLFVYHCDLPGDEPAGTIVLEVTDEGCKKIVENVPDFDLTTLRGGSQLVPCPNGYLALTHESFDHKGKKRTYLHRWVEFSEGLCITRVSDLFYFHHRGIEFCAGLAPDGNDFWASYGVDDAEAWLARFSWPDIHNALRTPP